MAEANFTRSNRPQRKNPTRGNGRSKAINPCLFQVGETCLYTDPNGITCEVKIVGEYDLYEVWERKYFGYMAEAKSGKGGLTPAYRLRNLDGTPRHLKLIHVNGKN